MRLRAEGLQDTRVLSALERVPRERFVPEEFVHLAYRDSPLPIACGQTISAPSMVAHACAALAVEPHHIVLEIGAGSGYQAAVLGALGQEVHSLERYNTLADGARKRLQDLGISNVHVHVGDGYGGWPEAAPYDRIVGAAAAGDIPPALIAQLAPDGMIVMPVGPAGGVQTLVRLRKEGGRLIRDALMSVRFVPMVEGVATTL